MCSCYVEVYDFKVLGVVMLISSSRSQNQSELSFNLTASFVQVLAQKICVR